jgi:hypothetical protein
MDTGKDKSSIVTLGRDNYARWRIEVETALRGKGLWQYVTGDVPVVAAPASDAQAQAKKDYWAWDEKDATARAAIIRTLDDVTFNHVADCLSSKAIYERIAELRDPKSVDVLMASTESFFGETWQQVDDVSSFMARLAVHSSKVNSFKDKEVRLGDKCIMAKTLTSLPAQFSNFVSSWRMMAKPESTLTEFREKLLAAERAMTGSSGLTDGLAGEALAARSKPPRRQRKEIDKSKSKCHKCKELGHWKDECPELKKKTESSSKKEDGNAFSAFGNIALTAQDTSFSDTILADSGASRHMTGVRSWFRSIRRLERPLKFQAAGSTITAYHEGDIVIEKSVDGKKWEAGTWNNVLYVPGLQISLFSTTMREDEGFGFRHSKGSMVITKDGKPVIGGQRIGHSYKPYIRVIAPDQCCMAVQSIDVWHQRLGHISDDVVKAMSRNGVVQGLAVSGSKHRPCDACHFGRQTANNHPSRPMRDCEPRERLHSDVCHATVKSIGGSKMFVTLKDESSGYRMVRFLKSTNEVK